MGTPPPSIPQYLCRPLMVNARKIRFVRVVVVAAVVVYERLIFDLLITILKRHAGAYLKSF